MKFTAQQLVTARHNLSAFVVDMADMVTGATGIHFVASSKAPETLAEIKAEWDLSVAMRLPFTVWSGASDATIYMSKGANWAFRFWHDYLHVAHLKETSLDDELYLGRLHIEAVEEEFGKGSLEALLMEADTIGQSNHCDKTGAFPEDQLQFAIDYINAHKG